MAEIPSVRRRYDENLGGAPASLSDMVFGFLEDHADDSPESRLGSGAGDYDYGEEVEESCDVEENKAFWEEQMKLLQVRMEFFFFFSFFCLEDFYD